MSEVKKTTKTKIAKKESKIEKKLTKKTIAPKKVITEPTIESAEQPAEPVNEVMAKEPETAKAGKRSPKAQKETADKQAKEMRKTSPAEKTAKPAKKPTRPKTERAGKKYRESAKLIDETKAYSVSEAIDLAIKTASTKFDSSVELHVNLGVDPKQADQNIRDSLVLPAGTGKSVRVAVLADEEQAKAGGSAGADISNSQTLIAQLDKEQIEFDILIAMPTNMAQLGKYARLLGPRGLMPNPKSGTVTNDIAKAVKEAKAGKVEYRVDPAGIVHLAIGKVSFGNQKIAQNAEAAIGSIKAAKPASLKGIYIKSAYLTTTMGPSVKIDIS